MTRPETRSENRPAAIFTSGGLRGKDGQLDLFPETLPQPTPKQLAGRSLITELARAMLEAPQEMRLVEGEEGKWNTHEFFPGLYMRSIIMPAGSRIMSRTHLTKHPFFILAGKCAVADTHGNVEVFEAPVSGVTLPDTQRVLHVLEDTWWITVHPNPDDLTDVAELEDRLTTVRYV